MVKITICNWKDYIPRTDYKSMPWLRLPSRTYRVRETYASRTSVRWLHVCLLCIAAEENAATGVFECPLAWLEDVSGTNNVVEDLQFLAQVGLISLENLDLTYVSRTCHERPTNVSRTDDERVTNVPRSLDKKEREEKREEEKRERKGESLREPIFDAAGGGSLSLVNSGTKKRKPKAVQVIDLSDAELDLGTQWLKLAVTHFPHKATDPKWTPDQFAFELRKVANTVGLSIAQMVDLLAWVKADTFWCNKVASPYGLLKKSTNGLRKIENALASSKSKAQIRNDQIKADWDENPEKKASWELAMRVMRGEVK